MMLDGEISAVNPASTYRILSTAKIWDCWNKNPAKMGLVSSSSLCIMSINMWTFSIPTSAVSYITCAVFLKGVVVLQSMRRSDSR